MDIFEDKKFEPMLLHEIDTPFDDENYIFELKLDGTRVLIYIDEDEILIRNKRGHILNEIYPELIKIKENFNKKVILDGEVVLMKEGKPSFSKLQERAMVKDKLKIKYNSENYPVTFVCFDILYENKDLTNLPLLDRKIILNKYDDTERFVKSKFIPEKGKELYEMIKKEDLEGIVAKKKNGIYKINTRSREWIKIKNLKDEDFYVVAFNEDTKGVLASISLARKILNKYEYVGNVTIGKNNPDFKRIKECKKMKLNKIKNYPNDNYTMIEAKLKCTVNFVEKTATGSLRQPIFKCLIN